MKNDRLEKVWNIVQNDLPVLRSTVDEMLGPDGPARPVEE